ncbi:MAG: hypothetical protein L6R41_003601 [Letrouitia leprolyta]|nr:MAG: hypothetical protein L6R41_003601 [Letrouitia leprolyta]
MPIYSVRYISPTLPRKLPDIQPQITLKEGGASEQLAKAKEDAKAQGGEIKHEFTLIKGFTVDFPPDRTHTLETNEHIHVEQDGEVKTQ